jgi:geranylgeranyl pyrophosphate synthase
LASNQLTKANFLAPVQDLLVRVEQKMQSQADQHHPDLHAALEHLLSSGGKRLRPALALLMGNLFLGDEERLITLAAAIEMLHTATLVHDDLIDGALLRRGIATLNSRWSPAATVLTGDFIFARAARLAAETRSVEVMLLFAETLSTIVNGEITQLFSSRGLASRQDYERRIYAKTASVFDVATRAAGLLSQVDEMTLQKIGAYGYNTGMAFQIIDDILDFTGEQATIGKPVASDLRQGLITLPALYYLEKYPQDAGMRRILAGESLDEEAFTRLIASIRESGAIQDAYYEARKYVDTSVEQMDGFPDRVERQSLVDLAYYIVNRQF